MKFTGQNDFREFVSLVKLKDYNKYLELIIDFNCKKLPPIATFNVKIDFESKLLILKNNLHYIALELDL